MIVGVAQAVHGVLVVVSLLLVWAMSRISYVTSELYKLQKTLDDKAMHNNVAKDDDTMRSQVVSLPQLTELEQAINQANRLKKEMNTLTAKGDSVVSRLELLIRNMHNTGQADL